MPEPQAQISQQQIALMVDIIGGLAGQYASSLVQTGQQQQAPVVKSSPYYWKKFFIKRRPEVRPTRPESPQAPAVKAPKVHVPANPRPTASSQQPSRPLDFTPPQQAKAPPPQPPQDQHQILEEIEKGTQHHLRPSGTELPHWIRVRQINRSVLSQYEAIGVGSLNELVDILNNQDYPTSAVNLTLFHDDSSPFVILSEPKQTLESGGTPAVVVGFPYSNQVHNLETAFPGIHFMTSEEAPKEIEEAAASLPKPLPRQSPYAKGFRVKSVGESDEPKKPESRKNPQSSQSVTPQFQSSSQQDQSQLEQKPLENLSEQGTRPYPQQSFSGEVSPESDIPNPPVPTNRYTPEERAAQRRESEQHIRQIGEILPDEGEHLIEEYVSSYERIWGDKKSSYSTELPDDSQLENVEIETFRTISRNEATISKVISGGIPFLYKAVGSESSALNETATARFAEILDVPAPRARQVAELVPNVGGVYPVLFSWVDGHTLSEFITGFIQEGLAVDLRDLLRQPKSPLMFPLLEKIIRPGDLDLQLLFGYLVGSQDRHWENYMISGDRLVTIDHEDKDEYVGSPHLHGMVNDVLFTIKAAHYIRTWNRENIKRVPLNVGVADRLLSKTDDLVDEARRVSPQSERALTDRLAVLKRFVQGRDRTFNGLVQAFERLHPRIDWY